MAGKKLLVADDSLTIQKVIRLALSNEGYEIQAVSDGNDAVQQISLFRPQVVLIDVSLPGKSAVEVKAAINQDADLEEVRFVLMSSAFEKIDESALSDVGFHGRLTKPFDPAHLRQVLNDVLAQVTAKRMEPTTMLGPSMPPPLPSMGSTSEFSESEILIPPFPLHQESSETRTTDETPGEGTQSFMLPPRSPTSGGEMPGELWENESENPAPAFHPEFPPPPILKNDVNETDIKHLTESTIRMSGLDDFQWSVNEPSIKPPIGMADLEGASFTVEAPPRFVETEPDASIPTFVEPSAPNQVEIESLVRHQVTEQVTEMVERLARQILPEVAEKVIKQELRRLLSERP